MAAEERAGGKGFVAREREEGNQAPSGHFYRRGKPQPRPCEGGQMGKRATVAHSCEKLKAPTSSDSRARRTRALNSQAKRPVQPGRDGTAVSSPHTPRLKRSALKSYVRAVPSRGRGARPPADQASHGGLRRASDSVSPDPITTPSKNCKAVFRRAKIPSRPTPTLLNESEESLSRPKIPRPWPPTFQRLRD